jgi:hypothetical protein
VYKDNKNAPELPAAEKKKQVGKSVVAAPKSAATSKDY